MTEGQGRERRAITNSGDAVQKYLRFLEDIAVSDSPLAADAGFVLEQLRVGEVGILSDPRLAVDETDIDNPSVVVLTVGVGSKSLPTVFVSKSLMGTELTEALGFERRGGALRETHERVVRRDLESIESSIRTVAFGLRTRNNIGGNKA